VEAPMPRLPPAMRSTGRGMGHSRLDSVDEIEHDQAGRRNSPAMRK
jgi:hypothetical protein